MSDAELHDALLKHALTEQGWAGPGADLTGIPLRRMLDVEEGRFGNEFHVDPRAIAAIYVAFNYDGSKFEDGASPVAIANGQAVCLCKLPTGADREAAENAALQDCDQ